MWEYHSITSQFGEFHLVGQGGLLQKIYLPGQQPTLIKTHWQYCPEAFQNISTQLKEYFAGTRRQFSIDYQLELSAFQKQVLAEVRKVPFGETVSYQEIANRLHNPLAVRAVGAANGKNPLPIIIPCHRVIGSTQQLTGYAGGIELKRKLLEFESKQLRLF